MIISQNIKNAIKRTETELKEHLSTTLDTINHLESIQTALDLSENEGDLDF